MVIVDTTTLSYWLNWRVFVCATWVLSSIVLAIFLICKYEDWSRCHTKSNLKHPTSNAQQQQLTPLFSDDDAWRPCIKQIHPIWLLVYRVFSFAFFLAILLIDIVGHGPGILYYYTQWTFTLVTLYFGLGATLSIYGCSRRRKVGPQFHVSHAGEEESYLLLAHGQEAGAVVQAEECYHFGARVWGFVFQVIFQVIAGAVVLTDTMYWSVIFPFLTIRDYDLNSMTYIMHSLNAVFLLGDTALNCLRFPWFRIAYFILWTGIFVIVQWIIHACVSIWWPYPFLDLSLPSAPFWYVLVGLMHIPCYGIFVLVVEIKVHLLSKFLPQSSQCCR